MSPLNATEYFLIYSPITSTRSNIPSLLKPLHSSRKLSASFFYRSVDAWNHFPCNIKLLTSLYSFKLALKLVDLSAYLKCSFFKQLTPMLLLFVLLCCIYIYWIVVSSGIWPLLQATNCMYFNYTHTLFLLCICNG